MAYTFFHKNGSPLKKILVEETQFIIIRRGKADFQRQQILAYMNSRFFPSYMRFQPQKSYRTVSYPAGIRYSTW